MYHILDGLKSPRIREKYGDSLVPPAGIEPARYRYRGILSPLRLPVPPWRHITYGIFQSAGFAFYVGMHN